MKTIASHKVSEEILVEIVDIGEAKVAAVYLHGEYVDELYLDDDSKDIPVILDVLSSAVPEYYVVYEAIDQICARLIGGAWAVHRLHPRPANHRIEKRKR